MSDHRHDIDPIVAFALSALLFLLLVSAPTVNIKEDCITVRRFLRDTQVICLDPDATTAPTDAP